MNDIQVRAIMAAILYGVYAENQDFREPEAVELAQRLFDETIKQQPD